MKNIIRNRTILGIACIVLSLIICFGLTPLFNDAIGAKTFAVRVAENIAKGEMITAKKLKKVEIGGYNLPDSVLKNPQNIIGKYAKADLYKGDYILNTKISSIPLANYEYLYDFTGIERAISVSIKSFAAGLSGKLESGDIVSIMVSEYGELKETISPDQLQYVEVLAVTAGSGKDTDEYQNEQDESIEKDKNLPSTITLRVSPEQEKLLAEYERKGKIHVVFVYRGSKENTEKFLEEQSKILSGDETEEVEEEQVENSNTLEDTKTTENTTRKDESNAEE